MNTGKSLLIGAGALLMGASTLMTSPANAVRRDNPAARPAIAPNVAFPVDPAARPVDAANFRLHKHNATDIAAACGSNVVAATAGTVRVSDAPWAGGSLVRVVTSYHKLTTWYLYLGTVTVSDKQIVSAGQQLGTVGSGGRANGTCELGFQVRDKGGKAKLNPTTWLGQYVGQPSPATMLFNNNGFVLTSMNTLGASHTDRGGDAPRYPGWARRLPFVIDALNAKAVDVVGFQEFQRRQRDRFVALAGSTYGVYSSAKDTENSIAWNKKTFTFVEGATFPVTYFNGSIRQMPYVLLRQNATGLEAYFINVHNPAETHRFRNQGKWRAEAIARERALVIQLRATGKPVFLTGDFNDRGNAFCPLTEGKLMLSADSVPSTTCALPKKAWIDWIYAAGPARFTTYERDWSLRDLHKATDHPMVTARTYLAPQS